MKVKSLFLLMIMSLFNSMLSGSATAQNIATSESVAVPTGGENRLGPKLVDEARLMREYQKRFKRDVLIPSEFPFEITHFNGYVDDNESLALVYRNKALNSFFRVKIFPIEVELEKYKGKFDVYYQLKDGTRALYRAKFELAYELRFQKNGMQYTLAIGNKKMMKTNYKATDLLKLANSML